MSQTLSTEMKKYVAKTQFGFTKRGGDRTSIRLPVVLIEAAKEFCHERHVSLTYLCNCIDRARPEEMSMSEACRCIFVMVKEHPEEIVFND